MSRPLRASGAGHILDVVHADRLAPRIHDRALPADRCGGLPQQMTQRVLESVVEGEITGHLGCDQVGGPGVRWARHHM
ncbi:hypothetical protein ACFVYV_34920 [Streptomyces mirabilis]|uniref:hypothetical protein n=1 Tax=Streptomyces TaxID=1883 RepID=UPI000BB0D30C|nr:MULTISPECIES: hypothetical protein [unclassified Streptomyces]